MESVVIICQCVTYDYTSIFSSSEYIAYEIIIPVYVVKACKGVEV